MNKVTHSQATMRLKVKSPMLMTSPKRPTEVPPHDPELPHSLIACLQHRALSRGKQDGLQLCSMLRLMLLLLKLCSIPCSKTCSMFQPMYCPPKPSSNSSKPCFTLSPMWRPLKLGSKLCSKPCSKPSAMLSLTLQPPKSCSLLRPTSSPLQPLFQATFHT